MERSVSLLTNWTRDRPLGLSTMSAAMPAVPRHSALSALAFRRSVRSCAGSRNGPTARGSTRSAPAEAVSGTSTVSTDSGSTTAEACGGSGAADELGGAVRVVGGVEERALVLGGQHDPALGLPGQFAHGAVDALPARVGRRVPQQGVVDLGVGAEVLALLLADRAGGRLHGEPGGGGDRARGHQRRHGQQPPEQALAERQPRPLVTTTHGARSSRWSSRDPSACSRRRKR